MTKQKKYTTIVLIILLALAVLYIAYAQYSISKKDSGLEEKLQLVYKKGVVDGQKNALLALLKGINENGWVRITNNDTNQSLVLVPYIPKAE